MKLRKDLLFLNKTSSNSLYVAIAGEVGNRRAVLLRNFVLNGKESASNPLLHIHVKRWWHMQRTTEFNTDEI